MEKTQMDRMEGMLANLISVVGSTNQQLKSMDQQLQSVVQKQESMEQTLQSVVQKQESMEQILQRVDQEQQFIRQEMQTMKTDISGMKTILVEMRAEQDYLWEKTVKNERELVKFKSHLQL